MTGKLAVSLAIFAALFLAISIGLDAFFFELSIPKVLIQTAVATIVFGAFWMMRTRRTRA
jgi:hypothetical protein